MCGVSILQFKMPLKAYLMHLVLPIGALTNLGDQRELS